MKVTAHLITDFDNQPIPDGWQVDPEQPDHLLPPWSYCQHRRLSYRPQPLTIFPHCLLVSKRVTTETCVDCNRQEEERVLPDTSGLPRLEKSEDWQEFPAGYTGSLVDVGGVEEGFESRERPVRIESDGAIVYEKRAKDDWEPPRDIAGYQRDPENPWRFVPLWPKCVKRQHITKRNTSCGGIFVIMTCTNPNSKRVGANVTYRQCQHCHVREEKNQ